MRSPWRTLLYEELEGVSLSGNVLDLAGPPDAEYHKRIKGDFKMKVNNLDEVVKADYRFDLEHMFPIKDATYDGVLCINVLEHIYNYRNVLKESHRVLVRGGTLVVGVPFLIRVHPSPKDYWRYTKETLENIAKDAGFEEVEVHTIGRGVFTAAYSLEHSLVKVGLIQRLLIALAHMEDFVVSKTRAKKHFSKENYPLGYLMIAKK